MCFNFYTIETPSFDVGAASLNRPLKPMHTEGVAFALRKSLRAGVH